MKNFYNERQTIVSDAIDGLIASSGGRLQRFDPSSHARVVVRADWDNNKVAITNAMQPRGLAGTCNAASAVAGNIRTLYLSRVTCKVPGSEKQTRIDGDEAGLGIHGLDWAILSNKFMANDRAKLVNFSIGPVPIMTAQNMPRFSISLVLLESNYQHALLSEIDCAAWPDTYTPEFASPLMDITGITASDQCISQYSKVSANGNVIIFSTSDPRTFTQYLPQGQSLHT